MSCETLLFEEKGTVGTLTLNRPAVINAMNRKMIELILQQLKTRLGGVPLAKFLGAPIRHNLFFGVCAGKRTIDRIAKKFCFK